MELELAEKNERITYLEEQLKMSMQMDQLQAKQAVATLKGDIRYGLQLEYQDYLDKNSRTCNPDTFEAYRGSLNRIFRTLRRCGIQMDDEQRKAGDSVWQARNTYPE